MTMAQRTTHLGGTSHILAVKLADMGDALLCTPALRALRQTYPDARLDALVTPHTAHLIEHTGLVDHVITFPKHEYDDPRGLWRPGRLWQLGWLYATLRAARYDAVALFHHLSTDYGVLKWRLLAAATGARRVAGLSVLPVPCARPGWPACPVARHRGTGDNDRGRGWLTCPVPDLGFGGRHEVEHALAVAEGLGARTDDTSLALPPFADEEEQAASLSWPSGQGLLGNHDRPYVVVHAGSGGYSRARRWDPERFAAVADALIDRLSVRVVIVGTAADDGVAVAQAMRHPALNLQGRTDLSGLAAVLRRCGLFVGADSGVMHLAAAAGAPVVAIFGPSNHRAWAPWAPPERVRIVRLGLPCSPCSYIGTRVGARDGCPQRTCMADLGPEPVIEAALSLYSRSTYRTEKRLLAAVLGGEFRAGDGALSSDGGGR